MKGIRRTVHETLADIKEGAWVLARGYRQIRMALRVAMRVDLPLVEET